MRKELTIDKIEREITRLAPRQQLKLVERLLAQLKKHNGSSSKKQKDWTKLYGLGKGLWKHEDAQAYVNRMREDRL